MDKRKTPYPTKYLCLRYAITAINKIEAITCLYEGIQSNHTLRPFIYKLLITQEILQNEVTLNETSRFSFEDKLVLSLKLDFYGHNRYSLYEQLELPTSYSNPGFAAIQPRARYLALDPSRRDHIFISTEDFNQCQSTKGRRHCNYTPNVKTDDGSENVLTRYPSANAPDDCIKHFLPGPSWF